MNQNEPERVIEIWTELVIEFDYNREKDSKGNNREDITLLERI